MSKVVLQASPKMEQSMPTGKHLPMASAERGFTLLAVMAAMFMLALGTQRVMSVVSQQAHREREAELLQIGAAFAQAIGAYYESSPGTVKRWPMSLKDLEDDKRFVGIRRHVRQVYMDPITRSENWGLVRANDGGIAGVYSLSDAVPIRSGALTVGDVRLPAASRYADWQFVYEPATVTPSSKP
jgi:type II secretory pathway pseudopilin PulG